MTPRELIEMASLDVMGLLDEREREDFDRAFRAASPEVQAHVRREQLRFAKDDQWLPPVDQPAGLRARVLAAVREAIEAVSSPLNDAETDRLAPIPFPRAMRTAALWRAACIGFATASVVLSWFVFQVQGTNRRLAGLITTNASTDQFQALGPRFVDVLFSANRREVAFAPAAADIDDARARILLDPERKIAVLVCDNLPVASGSYTLVVQEPNRNRELQKFESTGGVVGVPLQGIEPAMLASLAIVGPAVEGGQNEVIFRSGDV